MPRRALHLTFDDGPCPTWTPRILDALAANDAQATFFVLGTAVRRHPELVARTVAAGHRIGLHGHRHERHDRLSPTELAADTDAALDVLAGVGVRPTWWRTPWGLETVHSRDEARSRSLRLVRWDADTHDWRGDDPAAMVAAVERDAPDGGVVLAHDALGPGATRTDCAGTVAFVARVAAWARARELPLLALPGLTDETGDDPSGRPRTPVVC